MVRRLQRAGSLLGHVKKGRHLTRKDLGEFPGVHAKWAMCECVIWHLRGRFG
jgi:hypothetical protein